ncbi:hypothetical protein CW713_07005 [Methanophagales archaeon]|nr:MAG: hypothetical protein CW713_07005 [Methanophagales archaeon]
MKVKELLPLVEPSDITNVVMSIKIDTKEYGIIATKKYDDFDSLVYDFLELLQDYYDNYLKGGVENQKS